MIKTIPARFTLNDLLAHLRETEGPEDFFTLVEWRAHLGLTEMRMRSLMKDAKAAGLLDVSRARRERLDGVMTPVPVYRFNLETGTDNGIDGDRGEVYGEQSAGGGA